MYYLGCYYTNRSNFDRRHWSMVESNSRHRSIISTRPIDRSSIDGRMEQSMSIYNFYQNNHQSLIDGYRSMVSRSVSVDPLTLLDQLIDFDRRRSVPSIENRSIGVVTPLPKILSKRSDTIFETKQRLLRETRLTLMVFTGLN
jgi:hypothetical protein